MGHTWSQFFCQKAIEEAIWATLGLGKAEILEDTRSCVVPRLSGQGDDAESSHRASKRFSYVYVDNLGVLGTSRVNVDEDLTMAVQTQKNRGLDTHEEIVHSDTATALGILIDLRIMLVSVAPMRLWRLKQGLRWALRCRALPGKTWKVLLVHKTFVALLRRDVLSVPFAEPKCKPCRSSAGSWTRGWCSSIVATDAS